MNYRCNWGTCSRPWILVTVLLLSIPRLMTGQVHFADAPTLARGKISSLPDDNGGYSHNPATIALNVCHSVTAWHARPFLLQDLGVSGLSAVIKAFPGNFRCALSSYGIQGYREFATELGYGMKLADRITAGVSFQYNNTSTEEEWNYLWTIGLSAGIMYRISPTTTTAICMKNPVTIGNSNQYGPVIPSRLSAGINHKVYDNTFLMTEISFFSGRSLRLKTAARYTYKNKFSFTAGYHSSPATLSFGMSFAHGKLRSSFAFAWTSSLGITPAVNFEFINK